MTEDQIERRVERQMNRLDRRYLDGEMDASEYQREVDAISLEANLLLQSLRNKAEA